MRIIETSADVNLLNIDKERVATYFSLPKMETGLSKGFKTCPFDFH